jgi:hypothetical protein
MACKNFGHLLFCLLSDKFYLYFFLDRKGVPKNQERKDIQHFLSCALIDPQHYCGLQPFSRDD